MGDRERTCRDPTKAHKKNKISKEINKITASISQINAKLSYI